MAKPDYDTTVARIAGNIASGVLRDDMTRSNFHVDAIAGDVVRLARAVVAEVRRTEPSSASPEYQPISLGRLVRDLQVHAKEQGWQDVDEPLAALLAWEPEPVPPVGEE